METENFISLFYGDSLRAVSQLKLELGEVTKSAGYELSLQQVTDIYEMRNRSLIENHLIDFSFRNTIGLTEMLLEQIKPTANSLVNDLQDITAIFYYLRSSENDAYSDEDIIEQIETVLSHYANDLENTRGYFESHPLLSEGDSLWNMD